MEIIALELILVYVVNVAARWFPWRVLPMLTKDGLLRREVAYVYGTAMIVLGYTVWAVSQDVVAGPTAAAVLVANALAGGAAVLTSRLIDALCELRAMRADEGDYEQAIQARE